MFSRIGSYSLRIGLSILAAAAYGIANDQVTVSLSPEYFSVFKREQFAILLYTTGLSDAPIRVQAVAVGIASTWWFGLTLGIVLSIAGAKGPRPTITTRVFWRVVVGIMGLTLALSVVAGLIGYMVEPLVKPTTQNWPFLAGIHEVRAAFAVGVWHSAAYLGGVIGTILGIAHVGRLR